MASTAEVDLVISTAGTLPELERDLNAIIRTAENGAPTLDVDAALAVGESLSNLAEGLDSVIRSAEAGAGDIELEAALDAQRSLAHVQGQLESLVQRASQGEEIDLQAELDQVGSLTGISNQIRSLVREAEAAAPEIELEVEVDRDGEGARSVLSLGRALGSLAGALPNVSGRMLAFGSAAAAALPAAAALSTAVESILPASAVAVSGLTSLILVAGATGLAFQGVGDAVSTAFDPEAKPEELAKAMAALSPNAAAFVTQLRSMRKEFKTLQQDVQETFFQGLDGALERLGTTTLPVVGNALRSTALQLNAMALGAAGAASQLAESGVLGRALEGATLGLANLTNVPGQFVTALGQIGAAAAPVFDRLTTAAGSAAERVSERLTAAFESGALESAIDGAIDSIAQLGRIGGNVFEGLGNVFDNLNANGEGLFAVLEKVTAAFANVTASQGFQQALTALAQTLGVVVDTVLPLLSQALQALGPVFQSLAAPIQILVRALGDGLSKIMVALAPVLVAVGNAFGQLVLLATPFINLAATAIATILPGLTPLFESLGQAINAMLPFVEQLVTNLSSTLLPVLSTLATEVLPQVLPPFLELATKIFPVLTEVLVALAPSMADLGLAFGELLVAVTPLIVELANLTIQVVDKLLPVIQPLIDIILNLVNLALKVLTAEITGVVIPAIGILVNLLQGDFSAAWEGAKDLVRNVATKINEHVKSMSDRVVQILSDLGIQARDKVLKLTEDVVRGFLSMVNRVADVVRGLPATILNALGDLGNLLRSAGADIVRGLIDGISSQLGRLRDKAAEIAGAVSGSVKGLLGIESPSKVMMDVGHDTMEGFRIGLADGIPDLRRQLQGVAALAPSFALPNGQTIQLPQLSQQGPVVQVFIGNEQLNGHVDSRIARSDQARNLLISRGTRR